MENLHFESDWNQITEQRKLNQNLLDKINNIKY